MRRRTSGRSVRAVVGLSVICLSVALTTGWTVPASEVAPGVTDEVVLAAAALLGIVLALAVTQVQFMAAGPTLY